MSESESPRVRRLVGPRQISMHLARSLTNASLTEIGQWFGGRDHSSVVYALQRAEERLAKEADFARTHASARRAFGFGAAD